MNRRWVCTDIWMDMFPFFDRLQLGLNLALLSPRFDILVEKHFDGKRELPIWRTISIYNDSVEKVPKLRVFYDFANSVPFPLPDRPLPDKIRFKQIRICYIDHFVIAFLRANQKIFNNGSKLEIHLSWNSSYFVQPIWNALARHILPIFVPNIRQLKFKNANQLYCLLRFTSPKVLSDLNIHSIDAGRLFPNAIDSGAKLLDEICGDSDQPIAYSAGQILSEWLHIPAKDGQPKKLICWSDSSEIVDLVNNFKKKFRRATTSSASYQIQFTVYEEPTEIVPFQLVNERTNEKLTLEKEENNDENMEIEDDDDEWDKRWIMKRCKIGETTAALNENSGNLNNISFSFYGNCIGRLSPPSEEEEEAGQSAGKESTYCDINGLIWK